MDNSVACSLLFKIIFKFKLIYLNLMFRKVIFVFLILINTSCYAFIENNRLFSQNAAESEERGYEARKTGVYAEVDAALSVKSSREFATAAEFEKKSNVLHVGVNYL